MLAGEFEKAADGGGIMPAACVEDERMREARLSCGLEARENGGAPAARRLTADEAGAHGPASFAGFLRGRVGGVVDEKDGSARGEQASDDVLHRGGMVVDRDHDDRPVCGGFCGHAETPTGAGLLRGLGRSGCGAGRRRRPAEVQAQRPSGFFQPLTKSGGSGVPAEHVRMS